MQEPPSLRHQEEDRAGSRYLHAGAQLDASALALELMPRGWLLVGVAGLAPAFVSGASQPSLAVGLGGVLLVYRSLALLSAGLSQVVGAGISWQQVAPLFHAAARPRERGVTDLALAPDHAEPADGPAAIPVAEGHDLRYRYASRSEPALWGCHLRIERGDRVLLTGTSGGGKSTLAALLTGLRQPESGLLLLTGLDRPTLGEAGWRRRVAASPQFHENHVLAETFAFNLLMGRRWPPAAGDLEEAQEVCHELGLGPLLERMPGGLMQLVGETGWQLSHGEKSRLFLARALLQGADLVVLDESFAALDPETLRAALECALRRAPSLLVVAHP